MLYTYRPNHKGAYIQCKCGSQFNEDRYGPVPKLFLDAHKNCKPTK